MDRTQILNRAFRAYLATDGATEQPIESCSAERCLNGLGYVVLANERRILAVYRMRHNGALRRLRVWPIELMGGALKSATSRPSQTNAITNELSHV